MIESSVGELSSEQSLPAKSLFIESELAEPLIEKKEKEVPSDDSLNDSGLGSSVSSSTFDSNKKQKLIEEFKHIDKGDYPRLDTLENDDLKFVLFSTGKSSQSESQKQMFVILFKTHFIK